MCWGSRRAQKTALWRGPHLRDVFSKPHCLSLREDNICFLPIWDVGLFLRAPIKGFQGSGGFRSRKNLEFIFSCRRSCMMRVNYTESA